MIHMITALKVLLVTMALFSGHAHGGPVHAGPPAHSAAYYKLYPCAPGHPPVSPDWGMCRGTEFIPS
jgi:hypothetical protein